MQRIPKRRYTAEFRAEAVKLVVGLAEAARRLDFPAKSLANWVRGVRAGKPVQGPRATGDGPGGREHAAAGGVCAAEDGARDSPKGGGILREGCAVRYAFIEAHRVCYPVPMMCELLEVSRSGYHAWRRRGPSPREVENTRLLTQIRAIHVASDHNYGQPRSTPGTARAGQRGELESGPSTDEEARDRRPAQAEVSRHHRLAAQATGSAESARAALRGRAPRPGVAHRR